MRSERQTRSQAIGGRPVCRHKVFVVALGLTLWGGPGARADSVFVKGGERFIGRILAEEPAKIIFESQTAGKIEIPRDRIERIEREPTVPPAPAPPAESAQATPPAATTPTNAPAVPVPVLTGEFFPWLTPESLVESNRFDWIQLKSGEWLKGRLKSLQEEKLEFDSEELDVHSFDWEDIFVVYSPRLQSVRFDTGAPFSGSVLVTTNAVRVISETATNILPRAELVAITRTGTRELDKWSAHVSVGLSVRSGNTKEVDYSTHATLERRTPLTRLNFDYLGNFGEINNIETENNQRLTGNFDYFLSRRLFVRVPSVEYYKDPFQNLDKRITLGAGVGYDLVHTRRLEWDVSTGPAYQRNRYSSVQTNESATADSLALTLGSRFDWEVTKRIDLIFEYRGQFTGRETGNSSHHTVSTLEFELHKRLNLDVSFIWDRIGAPKTEASGTTPFTDDYRLTLGLGIDF